MGCSGVRRVIAVSVARDHGDIVRRPGLFCALFARAAPYSTLVRPRPFMSRMTAGNGPSARGEARCSATPPGVSEISDCRFSVSLREGV